MLQVADDRRDREDEQREDAERRSVETERHERSRGGSGEHQGKNCVDVRAVTCRTDDREHRGDDEKRREERVHVDEGCDRGQTRQQRNAQNDQENRRPQAWREAKGHESEPENEQPKPDHRRIGERCDALEGDPAARQSERPRPREVLIDTDDQLEREELETQSDGEPGEAPAQAGARGWPSEGVGHERSHRKDEERAADVLLDEDRHGDQRAGHEPSRPRRPVARSKDRRDCGEDHEAAVGVIEGVREDRVDAEWHERDRKEGGQRVRARHDPGDQAPRDHVGQDRGEAAGDRGVGDLHEEMRAEQLDEDRLREKRERRLRQRELRIGHVAGRDPRRDVQDVRNVHEDGDLRVSPHRERRACEKEE